MRIRQKPDAIDLEHLKQTLGTRGYELIYSRVQEMLAAARVSLETQADPADFYRAQGRVEALRRVLELPAILTKEIREREAKKERQRDHAQ
jgi:hypothetical protein